MDRLSFSSNLECDLKKTGNQVISLWPPVTNLPIRCIQPLNFSRACFIMIRDSQVKSIRCLTESHVRKCCGTRHPINLSAYMKVNAEWKVDKEETFDLIPRSVCQKLSSCSSFFLSNTIVETVRVPLNAIQFIFFEVDIRSFEIRITV